MEAPATQTAPVPDAAPAPAPAPGTPPKTLKQRLAQALPWLSLAMGVASGLLMDRTPRRAALIAVAAVVGWGMLIALHLLKGSDPDSLSRRKAFAVRAARYSSLTATQSLIQLSVFFALPFYVRASVPTVGQLAYVVLLAAAGAATLWDPLFQRLVRVPLVGLGLQAIGSFAGLNAVLPMLGASNRWSLWIAAAAIVAGMPLVGAAAAEPGRRARAALRAGAVALAFPATLAVGAARLVPAAPMRLVDAAIGTRLAGPVLADPTVHFDGAPAQLVCATSIWAPQGLKDALFHVWRFDGEVVDRIPLKVSGGREQGFRTWSIKRSLRPGPAGTWGCSVETASGQVLGGREAEIAGSAPEPGAG